MQKNNNEILVAKAKKRDKQAFTDLMQSCMQEMYKVGISILMNDEDVADAIQDTILTCWEKLDTLKKNKYFKTWMIRILMNNCYAILNKNKRVVTLEEWEEPAYEDTYNVELKEALDLLDEKYRVIVMLFYGNGLSINEISELLNLNKSTIRTRLQRGREKLAHYYKDAMQMEGYGYGK